MLGKVSKGIRCALGLPGYEECGSRFVKYIIRSKKFGSYSYYILLPFWFLMLLILDIIYKNGNFIEKFFLMIVFLIGYIFISYDVTALECLFESKRKSEFYLATGVSRKDVVRDKGLLGEFNAYVLSRKVKIPHKTLYNVCVPMPNGSYQEIDAIIITNNYMYVIECKNRSGYFSGNISSEEWVQHIGNTENKVENIYLQNQSHISALEYFLKSEEIIPIRAFYCYNMILTGGDFMLDRFEDPLDFGFGNVYLLKNSIASLDKKNDTPRVEGFMEKIYMALLPYSLNDKVKKDNMLVERDLRARNKEFARGKYKYYRFKNEVPNIIHENAILRKDNVFMQIGYGEDKSPIWITIPDLEYVEEGGKCFE